MNDYPVIVLRSEDRAEAPTPEEAIREHAATVRALARDADYLLRLLAEPTADVAGLLSRVQGLVVDLNRQAALAREGTELLGRACRAARYADQEVQHGR